MGRVQGRRAHEITHPGGREPAHEGWLSPPFSRSEITRAQWNTLLSHVWDMEIHSLFMCTNVQGLSAPAAAGPCWDPPTQNHFPQGQKTQLCALYCFFLPFPLQRGKQKVAFGAIYSMVQPADIAVGEHCQAEPSSQPRDHQDGWSWIDFVQHRVHVLHREVWWLQWDPFPTVLAGFFLVVWHLSSGTALCQQDWCANIKIHALGTGSDWTRHGGHTEQEIPAALPESKTLVVAHPLS